VDIPTMNRVEVLLRTRTVTLSVFDHPPTEAHEDPPAERAQHDAISFVEAGTFTVRPTRPAAAAPWFLAPGMLFVTPREFEFACRHGDEDPVDRCLSVTYSAEAVEDLRGAGLPALRASGVRATPPQHFLRRRLRSLGARSPDARDALELELLAGALFESLAGGVTLPDGGRPALSGDVMRRIARAADHIEAEYARPLTLAELAATAGMSKFHFARVFGSLVGMPPHQYLIAVRLREAARRLELGASVTSTCYGVGFSSPSHFAAAFRRRFGVRPSALTQGLRPPLLRLATIAPGVRHRNAVLSRPR
jgi:AraC-like DNA-binding protein